MTIPLTGGSGNFWSSSWDHRLLHKQRWIVLRVTWDFSHKLWGNVRDCSSFLTVYSLLPIYRLHIREKDVNVATLERYMESVNDYFAQKAMVQIVKTRKIFLDSNDPKVWFYAQVCAPIFDYFNFPVIPDDSGKVQPIRHHWGPSHAW